MKYYFKLLSLMTLVLITSCDKEDDVPVNKAPLIEAQSYNTVESIGAETNIGQLEASDPEGDQLSYSITTNSDNLFEITSTGALSLVEGSLLDYESSTTHVLTVQVSDSKLTASAEITINVVDVDENVAPVIAAQTFTVQEDANIDTEIANIAASDANGDALTYSITRNVFQNNNNSHPIFELLQNDSGELRLASRRFLDFEEVTTHEIEITVTDGVLSASALITINVTNVNETPRFVAATQSFSVGENIAAGSIIGSVQATDPENDVLTFSLRAGNSDVFLVSNLGEVSLASGKILDYETVSSYSISVAVSDGGWSVAENITITITDEDEIGSVPFISTWETTTSNDEITIPTGSQGGYNYTVTWGDGTSDQNVTGNINHTYVVSGTYTVSITGRFPSIYFNKSGDDLNKIKDIQQWGNIEWASMRNAFRFCTQLNISATDAPDLSRVTSMALMFDNVYALTASLNGWDVSNVTNMAYVFAGATNFNQPLDQWNVSNVTSMSNMFLEARLFNQDISGWDVSSVTDVTNMFMGASSFSQDLSGWDTSNVTSCNSFGNRSGLTSVKLPTAGSCFNPQ